MSARLKEFIEILVGAISIVSLIGAAGFWLAALQIKKDLQNCDTLQAAKIQRQQDRNKIEIGLLKTRMKSVEKFLAVRLDFHEREEFPPDALPEYDTQDLGGEIK
ncbi:MAG TPA: hypothetical protein VK211_22170 [Kamptonema sp.]|nr:hypothetical protein [Kamptonema sp.]